MLHVPIPRMRLRRGRTDVAGPPPGPYGPSAVYDEIAAELPDEDLSEDLADTLDLYRSGSKPRCEEAEYRDLIQDAVDRMSREG
ncbi:hypothetical protein RM572_17655 [Streptomyces sp. DSM 42041]|uniref:Uncharacterized protein n=1 Tax=Streptomyces hazeniae TaxID=3075538 RepID=A0ABU2NX69_9ACTN|nr:hypothetical protein [Streptomyces sp. DSM 42041]MDT0380582.1 hypothetical protein [Streptomyces sp. DSM 42041]